MSWQPYVEPKGSKWKKGCGGCAIAAVAFVTLLVVIGAVASGVKQSAGSSARGGGRSSDAPANKAPAKPRTVLSESGNGIKSTEKFTVSGDWDLRYSFDCSSFGGSGNFVVSEGGTLGDTLVNELAAKGSDVTHLHDGGTKYLEINSECSWTVEAIDIP
ncbi:hypothetical protein AB0H73_21965 [Streptomyces olivoreticuli]